MSGLRHELHAREPRLPRHRLHARAREQPFVVQRRDGFGGPVAPAALGDVRDHQPERLRHGGVERLAPQRRLGEYPLPGQPHDRPAVERLQEDRMAARLQRARRRRQPRLRVLEVVQDRGAGHEIERCMGHVVAHGVHPHAGDLLVQPRVAARRLPAWPEVRCERSVATIRARGAIRLAGHDGIHARPAAEVEDQRPLRQTRTSGHLKRPAEQPLEQLTGRIAAVVFARVGPELVGDRGLADLALDGPDQHASLGVLRGRHEPAGKQRRYVERHGRPRSEGGRRMRAAQPDPLVSTIVPSIISSRLACKVSASS